MRDLVAVTALQSLLDSRRVDFDSEKNRAIHCEPHSLEPIELRVIIPLSHQIGVGDEDARCFVVCPKFADRFSRLYEKRLVIIELAQGPDDRIERLPASGCTSRPAINHKLIRIFGHLRIEIVHQHPHCGFLMPPFAAPLTAAWRVDNSFPAHDFSLSSSKSPRRIASATCAMSPENERSCVSDGAIFRTAANARSTPTPALSGRRCSKASAAASNSMASRFSASSTIDRNFKAAVIPMET